MYNPLAAYNYLLHFYEFGGLIFGGACFWNFTVSLLQATIKPLLLM